ncbi:3'-5' exonuclease [Polymorphospora sp. NPDC050346]|uniref:3'-5' exonuclease n=1 Tax=Polymorphospora sp. NPDC050346 TaxID=3155780 RepID=UPI0033C325AA
MTTETTEEVVGYGPHQLADRLGLYRGEMERAHEHGLVPDPDLEDGRWSEATAAAIAKRVAELRAELDAEQALGAARCARHLADRTGLKVRDVDITTAVDAGLLAAAGEYKGYTLYRLGDVDALVDDPRVARIVADRQEWLAASVSEWDAAARLAWRHERWVADAAAAGVTAGPLGRYAVADLDRLAADDEFVAGRLLGPNQAAEHLDVRRTDFDYAVAAGWLAAATYLEVPVGRRSTVTVPFYRQGDVDAVREVPGVDWHAVRETPPGRPSPLREYVRKPPSRAQVLRRIAADIGARFRVETWLYWTGWHWELDWETIPGGPTREQIIEAIDADPVAAQYRSDLVVATAAGAAVNWARAMLEPGAAVIVDTETADLHGAIIEIAAVDAHTGKTLLNTLVHPGPDQPIQPGAAAVHGLSDSDLAGAPTWDKVLPRLKRVTKNRQILAYNADYDQGVVLADTAAAGRRPGHLAEPDRWGCVMLARSDWERTSRWQRLGAGHRALGDAQAARQVLLSMTAPAHRSASTWR